MNPVFMRMKLGLLASTSERKASLVRHRSECGGKRSATPFWIPAAILPTRPNAPSQPAHFKTRRIPIASVLDVALLLVGCSATIFAAERNKPWQRHTIDDSSIGADGVRMADVNGDGLLDITTGWEEGGIVRVYLNPGHTQSKEKWPIVTVGKIASVEDAVFVDLDGDGAVDVVSSCEGKVRTMFVHWAPKDKPTYLDPGAWKTEALPASRDKTQWMFCLPMQVDGKNGIDLVAGAKNASAQLGWFEAPPNPRKLERWTWHPFVEVGWIMSLVATDMDGDGDLDIVFSDRKGKNTGCFWSENPEPEARPSSVWKRHPIGGQGREVMFLALVDLDRDGLQDVIVATKPQEILFLRRKSGDGLAWEDYSIKYSANTGNMKAVNVGDINLDGKPDIVFTCEGATNGKSGVMWLSYRKSPSEEMWDAHDISGPDGIKHDIVQLVDLDSDGDLDVITCEESKNLGVVWYENPTRSAVEPK
jgi:VCBS repeat protein